MFKKWTNVRKVKNNNNITGVNLFNNNNNRISKCYKGNDVFDVIDISAP